MDPKEFQARWLARDLSVAEIEEAATAWLAAGHDGPSLAQLAWPQDPKGPVEPVDRLVAGALRELGQASMSATEAGHWLIAWTARRVLAGEVVPSSAVSHLYHSLWPYLGAGDHPPVLDDLYAWLDSYYDAPDDAAREEDLAGMKAVLAAYLATA